MRGSLLGAFAIAVQFAERAALHMRRQIKALYKIHVSSSFLIRTYFEYSILSPERQAALKLHTYKNSPLTHPLVLTPSAYKRGIFSLSSTPLFTASPTATSAGKIVQFVLLFDF